MNYRRYTLGLIALLTLLFGSSVIIAQQTQPIGLGLNRIEGRVTDANSIGVNDVYVELYDNYNSLIGRQRTTGSGRYSFRGMQPGRYTLSVKAVSRNMLDETREVEINNSASRSDMIIEDFRLRPDTRSREDDRGIVGTVFAQEVPDEARRLYKSGIDNLQAKPEQALTDLEAAIKIYPTYFDALAALGKAYIADGKLQQGYPYLLRAIDVNTKCSDCFYSLALAFYKLKEFPAAVKAVDAAATLQPQSSSVRLLQGMILRVSNDLQGAEKSLLLAKSLFKEPNPEVHWQLSLVYNRLKRNKEAADELEQYLKIKPNLSEVQKKELRDLVEKLRKTTT